MGWFDTLRYAAAAEAAEAADRDPSTEETVINVPRLDNSRPLGSPPIDENELADDVKRRQVALAVAYAATVRGR